MSTPDKVFISKLGITQKRIAEALNISPGSLSYALNQKKDYLVARRLKLIENYIEAHEPQLIDEFKRLVEELQNNASFFQGDELEPLSSFFEQNEVKDMWWISNSPFFLQEPSAKYSWFQFLSNQAITLVFLLPSEEKATCVFKALRRFVSEDSEFYVHILSSSMIGLSPDLFLFNPSSPEPKLCCRGGHGELHFLSAYDTASLTSLLNAEDLGDKSGEAFSDVYLEKTNKTHSIYYTPEDFHERK